MITNLVIRMGAVSLIIAVTGFAATSCNSGDDITTTPDVPAETKQSAATTAIEDESPAAAGSDNRVEGAATSERAMQSELRNAAVAEESYYAENGNYTVEIGELERMGFEPSAGSNFLIVYGDSYSYCLETGNSNLLLYLDSSEGEPRQGSCR